MTAMTVNQRPVRFDLAHADGASFSAREIASLA